MCQMTIEQRKAYMEALADRIVSELFERVEASLIERGSLAPYTAPESLDTASNARPDSEPEIN